MIKFKDDSPRLQAEWNAQTDARIKMMVYVLSGLFSMDVPSADIIITCLSRTPKENKDIYGVWKQSSHCGQFKEYDENAKWGDVQIRAADIRTTNLTQAQINKALTYIKRNFVRSDEYAVILMEGKINNASTGQHLHIQVPAPFMPESTGCRFRL